MAWIVSDLLSSPAKVAADMDAAIEAETRVLRNPDKEHKQWSDRLAKLASQRAAYQNQQAEGLMSLDELRQSSNH